MVLFFSKILRNILRHATSHNFIYKILATLLLYKDCSSSCTKNVLLAAHNYIVVYIYAFILYEFAIRVTFYPIVNTEKVESDALLEIPDKVVR